MLYYDAVCGTNAVVSLKQKRDKPNNNSENQNFIEIIMQLISAGS